MPAASICRPRLRRNWISHACGASPGCLEGAGQAKAVGAADLGQGLQADVLFVKGHQIIARLTSDQRRAVGSGRLRSAIQMNRQSFEQGVQRHLAHHAHVLLMQRIERKQGGAGQLGIIVGTLPMPGKPLP
jgi:hypothetical protein